MSDTDFDSVYNERTGSSVDGERSSEEPDSDTDFEVGRKAVEVHEPNTSSPATRKKSGATAATSIEDPEDWTSDANSFTPNAEFWVDLDKLLTTMACPPLDTASVPGNKNHADLQGEDSSLPQASDMDTGYLYWDWSTESYRPAFCT